MQDARPDRWTCAIELAAIIGLGNFLAWYVAPRAADANWGGAATLFSAVVIMFLWMFWLSPRYLHRGRFPIRGIGGFNRFFLRPENLNRSVRNYALMTMFGIVALLCIRVIRDPANLPVLTWKAAGLRFLGYLVSSIPQALVSMEFFQPRLRAVWGNGGATWGTAILFSLFHFPNVPVMGLGLGVCLFWAREYLHRPNLVPVAMSHAILGSSLVILTGILPRVGPFYLEPEKYVIRIWVPWWGDLVNGLW